MLTAVVEELAQAVLSLREPQGKAPIRIRLRDLQAGPAILHELPPEGLLITRADCRQTDGGMEELRLDFANGSVFHAACRQVVVDVS